MEHLATNQEVASSILAEGTHRDVAQRKRAGLGDRSRQATPCHPDHGLWRSLVSALSSASRVGNPTAEGGAQWWATGLENQAGVIPEGSTPSPSSPAPVAQRKSSRLLSEGSW